MMWHKWGSSLEAVLNRIIAVMEVIVTHIPEGISCIEHLTCPKCHVLDHNLNTSGQYFLVSLQSIKGQIWKILQEAWI